MPEHKDNAATTITALQNVFGAVPANEKTASFVGVIDIGQGNLNAVFNSRGQPFLYFDLGRGFKAALFTFPEPEPTLCYAGLKMVVQSHLDEDHYMAGALINVRNGIVNSGAHVVLPQQAMGAFAQSVKAHLLNGGLDVHFWPRPNLRVGNLALDSVTLPGTSVEIIKCNGGGPNDSGLALRIRNPALGSNDWILLTADVHLRTDYFPWNIGGQDPDMHMAGLTPSHHGARQRELEPGAQVAIPHPPVMMTRSLVYSFGSGNTFGHPFNEPGVAAGDGVQSYLAHGWDNDGRLQTAGRPLDQPNFGPRGNVAILWPGVAAGGPGRDFVGANAVQIEQIAVALVATAAAAAQVAAPPASPRVPGAAAYQAALGYHVQPGAPVAAYIRQRVAPQAPIVGAATALGAPAPLAAHLTAAIAPNVAADASDAASQVDPLARAAVKLAAAAADAAARQLTQEGMNAKNATVLAGQGVKHQANAARQAVFNQQAPAGTASRVQGALAARNDRSAVPGLAFAAPSGIAINAGSPVVADAGYHRVVSLNYGTGAVAGIAGVVRTSGSADGVWPAARFQRPTGLLCNGNDLYVADKDDHTIRKIDLANNNVVSTPAGQAGPGGFADGPGNAAQFNAPTGLAVSVSGTNLYVADTGNHRIRQIALTPPYAVTTVAGQAGPGGFADGPGNAAQFNAPTGLAVSGNDLYVADTGNHRIRQIALTPPYAVTTVAGQAGPGGFADGPGNAARFDAPTGLAISGNDLYVADTGNHRIRQIALTPPYVVTTVAGQAGPGGFADGPGNAARFDAPTGLAISGTDLYVADTGNQTIRKIDLNPPYAVTTTTNGVVSELVAENLLSFGRAAAAQPPPTVADVTALANTLSENAAWAYCVAAANSPGRPENDPTAGGVLRPGMSPVAAANAAVTAIHPNPNHIPYVEDGFPAALAACAALGPAVETQTTGVALPGPPANRAEYEKRLMVAAVATMVGVRHGVGTIPENVRAAVAAARAAVAAARGGPIVGCHRHPSTCNGALCSLTLHEFIT